MTAIAKATIALDNHQYDGSSILSLSKSQDIPTVTVDLAEVVIDQSDNRHTDDVRLTGAILSSTDLRSSSVVLAKRRGHYVVLTGQDKVQALIGKDSTVTAKLLSKHALKRAVAQ